MTYNIPMGVARRTGIAIAMASVFLAPAYAGSLEEIISEPRPAAVAAEVVPSMMSDWTGGYVGGSIGFASIDGSFNGADLFAGSPEGISYGIHAGYNRDFGRLVVGGELQFEAMNVQEGSSFLKFDSIARAKVRAGYDAGAIMPYVTTGIAQATVSNSSFAGKDSGSFVGVGVDYMYGQRFTVGAEVLQNEFSDFDGSGVDLDATTAALRLSFSF